MTEGVGYITSIFFGQVVRRYPDRWLLMIEGFDPTIPEYGGQNITYSECRSYYDAETVYRDFWARRCGGVNAYRPFRVTIWPPDDVLREKPDAYYRLMDRPYTPSG